jgi:hypothetical protein
MATIGKVSAVFSASTSGLKAGVSEASTSFKKMSSDVSGLSSGMRSLNATQRSMLFGQVATAAYSAAKSIAAFGSKQAGVVDATRNLATRLGMTYGEFAGIAYAADLADVSMESVGNAAQKAEIAFAKASSGSQLATAAFGSLGLTVDGLASMNPSQRFSAIATALKNVPDSAERARLAVALFGKSGAQLLPMFESGATGIAEAVAEAERFGLTLNNQQATAVDNMGDSFQKAGQAVAGITQQVVAYLAPALEAITTTFTNLIGGIGGANIGQFIGEGIIAGAEFFATITDSIISGLTSVWEFVSTVIEQFGGVTSLFSAAGSALEAVWYAGEAVFKGIGVILMQSVAGWAGLLAELPQAVVGSGWAEFGKSMEASAEKLAREAEAAGGKSVNSALNVVGMGDKNSVGAAVKGPVSTLIADAAAAREAAAAKTTATTPTAPKKPAAEPVGASTRELKVTDSRSKEGVSEMLRLMRGGDQDVQKRQLEVLERIHEDLSDGDAEEIGVFPGA